MSVCPATLTTTSKDNTMNENKLSVAELEELIFKIDLMTANPSELFTTPEED
jgi:hypothetical protein